jgi:hypothetical protein
MNRLVGSIHTISTNEMLVRMCLVHRFGVAHVRLRSDLAGFIDTDEQCGEPENGSWLSMSLSTFVDNLSTLIAENYE